MAEDMNLIVATLNRVVICDYRGVILRDLFSEPHTGHYGITWNDQHMFVLCQDIERDLYGESQWISVLNRVLEEETRILEGKGTGIHQILWHDDRLWLCSSSDDRVIICTDDGRVEREWCPTPGSNGKNHINSIWFKGESLYLVAHAFSKDAAIYHFHYPSLELVRKYPLRGRAPHNVYIHREGLLTLCERGRIWWQRTEAPTLGDRMLKGLAVARSRVFVGAQRPIPDRVERYKETTGYLCLLHPINLQLVLSANLERGPINEIRVLDYPDLAHTGIPWMGRYGFYERELV